VESSSAKVVLVTDQPPISGIGVYTAGLYELLKGQFAEMEIRNLHYFRYPESPPHQPVAGQEYARSRFGALRARSRNERTLARSLEGTGALVHLCGAGYDLAALVRRPIATVHDFGLRTLGAMFSSRSRLLLVEGYSMIDWLRTPRYLKRCQRIVSISGYTRERLLDWTGLDSVVIPRWVDPVRFAPRSSTESRAQLRLPLDRKILLCVGSGAAYKNHGLLRRVAEALPSECLLVKVGFPLPGRTDQLRNEGTVSEAAYPRYFNAADAYLHLSTREGFGLPLLESMASGTPIVALANRPAPEILGRAARLLSPGAGPREVVAAIRSVVDSPSVSAQLAHAGRERLRTFDPAAIRAQYAELYLNAARA
jgi:glycosyltransferase involved in cell wall biosynthesis